MKNCTIVIEQRKNNKVNTSIFKFDDYRIATAIDNLLLNIDREIIEFDRSSYEITK